MRARRRALVLEIHRMVSRYSSDRFDLQDSESTFVLLFCVALLQKRGFHFTKRDFYVADTSCALCAGSRSSISHLD